MTKKSKAKPQQTIGIHSAGSVPVPFGGLLRDSQMKQLPGVEQQPSTMWWLNTFTGNLWIAEAKFEVFHSLPVGQHGTNTPWGFHLCYKQSQETSSVGTTGTAAALPPRHATAPENSLCFYIHCPLPMHLDCKWIQTEILFWWCSTTLDNRTAATCEYRMILKSRRIYSVFLSMD